MSLSGVIQENNIFVIFTFVFSIEQYALREKLHFQRYLHENDDNSDVILLVCPCFTVTCEHIYRQKFSLCFLIILLYFGIFSLTGTKTNYINMTF